MRPLLSNSALRVACLYLAVAVAYFVVTEGLTVWWGGAPLRWSGTCIVRWLVFVSLTAILIFLERRRGDRDSSYLASVAESAEAAIVGADAEGRITCWNRGAQVLYGYTAREACGQLGSMLHPPERRGDFEFILRRVHNGQTITNYETIRQRKDGSTFPVSLIVSPIRAGDGRVVGLSSIAHDISERQRAERAVQLAEVGQLASGLVHEIRNPLNAMRMQIAVIQDSLESPQAADLELACGQLERLEGEVLRVQKLADNFLAYGRPSRDNPQRIELRELLGKVAEFVRPEFNRARIAVELQLEESGGPLAVCMDRDKLRQILVNVAENARQATPRGGSLTIAAGRPDPDHVEIRLSDTGPGIEPDVLPRIFGAFFSTKEEGTGLGLAIVKKTVESGGGSVRAESQLGLGTTIVITLPAAPSADAGPAEGTAP